MILINLIVLIIAMSLTSTLLLGVMEMFQRIFFKYIKIHWICILMKIVMSFLLVPAVLLAIIIFYSQTNSSLISIQGDDFNQAKLIEFETLQTIQGQHKVIPLVLTLFVLWIIGFFISYFLIKIRDKNVLKVITAQSELENGNLEMIKKCIMLNMNMKKDIPIYKSKMISSPFLTGISNPKIFVPEMNYSNNINKLMLKHEIYHYKNHDLFYKQIVILIQSLYWFNPCVHFYAKCYFDNCEINCDTLTLNGETSAARSEYARTILSLLNQERPIVNMVGFFSYNMTSTKRRLYNIMSNKKLETPKFLVFVLILTTISLCPLTVYASTLSVAAIQSSYARAAFKDKEQEIVNEFIGNFEQYENISTDLNIEIISMSLPRGANLIDYTLDNTMRLVIESVSYKSGDKVQFILAATNSDDKFKAGITDSNGNSKYVNSSNGTISHTFTIEKSGTYDIYLQATSVSVHVTGSITM